MKKWLLIYLPLLVVLLSGCDSEDAAGKKSISPTENISEITDNEDLIAYLEGSTYESKEDLEVGLGEYSEVYGKWSIIFSESTFIWSHSDYSESGNYSLLDKNEILVSLSNTSFSAIIVTKTNEIEWDGITYVLANK